ncbi:hypothetical protein SCHPADRAFT_994144 [Schizopora paradoxa]|uniref:Nab2 type CCCH zinc finger 4 domain-containing protein n=1 Tax=Schizopora paradoxa TaxID=27342 RepID=A0A0H2S0U7_9AGAM|nr:hypothetical protein SCHPADRAFT_994144 [Schizopora paradoxa]
MPYGLVMGTEPAEKLQNAIQTELKRRGYGEDDADDVMSEYITIMLINNKTPEQITAELEDVFSSGADYDASFTDWIFAEAARIAAPESQPAASTSQPAPRDTPQTQPVKEQAAPPRPAPQEAPQPIPSTSQVGSKRTLSARSPSPTSLTHPNKTRRTDAPPTGPRSMHRNEGGRSLLERMGPRSRPNFGRDEIQARIEAVTNQQLQQHQSPEMIAAMSGFNNGMGGMMMGGDMNAAMGGMVNPLALQEMMMGQMALMAQMANNMGMLSQSNQMMMGQNGFPAMNGANGGGFDNGQNNMGHQQGAGSFRGGARGRGRGGAASTGGRWVPDGEQTPSQAESTTPAPIAAPTPKPATEAASNTARPGFVPPERPQSPTLCKFALKCTNPLCRYSHPSPVATPESGVVLSNDACEAGKNCKDKDCIKAHVSPAVANGAPIPVPHTIPEPVITHPSKPLCRYGAGCLRIHSGCPFTHPKTASSNGHFNQQCRFGAGCTRAACPFQHPQGRVLPTTFHRGLSTNTPATQVPVPETGSIGAASPHKSVVFNKSTPLAKTAVEAEKKMEKETAEVQAAA